MQVHHVHQKGWLMGKGNGAQLLKEAQLCLISRAKTPHLAMSMLPLRMRSPMPSSGSLQQGQHQQQ